MPILNSKPTTNNTTWMCHLDDVRDFRLAFFAAFAALASMEIEAADKGVLWPELSRERSVLTFLSTVNCVVVLFFLAVCDCTVDVSASSPYPENL
jgi:hypothetical protein